MDCFQQTLFNNLKPFLFTTTISINVTIGPFFEHHVEELFILLLFLRSTKRRILCKKQAYYQYFYFFKPSYLRKLNIFIAIFNHELSHFSTFYSKIITFSKTFLIQIFIIYHIQSKKFIYLLVAGIEKDRFYLIILNIADQKY